MSMTRATRPGAAWARWGQRAALLALCAAYVQGGLVKALDFSGAVAEMAHFGLQPAAPFAAATIALELGASALVISGRARWLGALALATFTVAATLLANRYWLASGGERFALMNAFYEHVGLAGGFLFVALQDLGAKRHA